MSGPLLAPEVGADGANRSVTVGDESPLCGGVGQYVSPAVVRPEAGLVQIEDVHSRGISRRETQFIGHPSGGEMSPAVDAPLHRGVLGHRGVAGVGATASIAVEVVFGLVVDAVEGEGVLHVVPPGSGFERIILSDEEVDPGFVFSVD